MLGSPPFRTLFPLSCRSPSYTNILYRRIPPPTLQLPLVARRASRADLLEAESDNPLHVCLTYQEPETRSQMSQCELSVFRCTKAYNHILTHHLHHQNTGPRHINISLMNTIQQWQLKIEMVWCCLFHHLLIHALFPSLIQPLSNTSSHTICPLLSCIVSCSSSILPFCILTTASCTF